LTCYHAGLPLQGDMGDEVVMWRSTSLTCWSKATFKSPSNFEVTRVFLPGVIYGNVEMYGIQWIFWVVFLY